jgi:hypothetical protein
MTQFLKFSAMFLTFLVITITSNHQTLSAETETTPKYEIIEPPVCFNYLNEPV